MHRRWVYVGRNAFGRTYNLLKMKMLRRAMIFLLVVGVILLLVAVFSYRLMHGSPTWYRGAEKHDPREVAAAADRLQHKVEAADTWTAIAQNQQQHPNAVPQNLLGPTTRPGVLDPLELTLSDEELNAFFERWDAQYHWTQAAAEYLNNPQVAIHEGNLILAATVPELKVVVSLCFRPTIDNGLLHLKLVRVMAGTLPLPQAVWRGYRDKVTRELMGRLPALQRSAALKPDGSANDQMVQVVLMKLMLHVVRDELADPVLFLPYMQNYREHTLPVKLTDARIDDETRSLILRFEPLDEADRDALVASVHQLPKLSSASD